MSNSFSGPDTWAPSPTLRELVASVFGTIIVTGIVGNVLVILLILAVKKMRSVVNLCLVSLAVADLIVLVFLPAIPLTTLFDIDDTWMGTNLCIFISSIDRGALVCSTLIFLLIGVERYSVLCHPLKSLGMWTLGKVGVLLAIILTITVGVSIPYGYAARYETWEYNNVTQTYCNMEWGIPWMKWLETIMYCVAFFLPILVMVVLYGKMVVTLRQQVPQTDDRGCGAKNAKRARGQVIRMLVCVVTIFVLCHLPFKIFVMLYFWDEAAITSMNRQAIFAVSWTCRILLYVNHASNPIVYFLMSAKFRQAFKGIFCRCATKKPTGASISYTESSRI